MKTISREEVAKTSPDYAEIMRKESHHDHEIIEDEQGTWRWKSQPTVKTILDRINFNDVWMLFHHMGLGKNDESVRKLYRDMGYSLSGYWEIFYWEMNNEDADQYRPEV